MEQLIFVAKLDFFCISGYFIKVEEEEEEEEEGEEEHGSRQKKKDCFTHRPAAS
jgi:hypothetical protein